MLLFSGAKAGAKKKQPSYVAPIWGYKKFTWGSFADSADLGGGQPLPMRNSLVPQTGHTPCTAGRLFFITMDLGFLISLLVLHFMQ